MPPTTANGKICYIEIPATDIERSADFYRRCFGWQTRLRRDGSTAFDDGVGEVSGTWVLGRPPALQPSLMVYIMVDSVSATLELIQASGGEIVQPIGGGRARNHREVPRSRRKRDRPLSGAGSDIVMSKYKRGPQRVKGREYVRSGSF